MFFQPINRLTAEVGWSSRVAITISFVYFVQPCARVTFPLGQNAQCWIKTRIEPSRNDQWASKETTLRSIYASYCTKHERKKQIKRRTKTVHGRFLFDTDLLQPKVDKIFEPFSSRPHSLPCVGEHLGNEVQATIIGLRSFTARCQDDVN